MPARFSALDHEFAVATGDNVDRGAGGPGTSSFDGAPGTTRALVITARPEDPDPYLFELGDRYVLAFEGPAGPVDLPEAHVIRSDEIGPGQGHAVVFEGRDGAGARVQLAWTPGFDLARWYRDHFDPVAGLGFYVYDQDPATEYAAPVICFEADTLIATPRGPVRAASLVPGMLVETLDRGPQVLLWVGQAVVSGTGRMAPVEFPAGALGNDRPLLLSPQHRVLHRSPMAELMFAEPEVLVSARAHAQAGALGATIRERPMIRYVHLMFERHEIVLAEGAPCESLYLGDVQRRALGPEARDEIAAHFPDLDFAAPEGPAFDPVRPILRSYEARALLGARAPAPPRPDMPEAPLLLAGRDWQGAAAARRA